MKASPYQWNFVRAVDAGAIARMLGPSMTPFEEWLKASDKGAWTNYLGQRWYPPEEWGVWGRGEMHNLSLVYTHRPQFDLELDAEVHVLLGGSLKTQYVDVFVAGEHLTTWHFTMSQNRAVRTIRLPKEAARLDNDFAVTTVEFRPRSTTSPQQTNPASEDVRQLGLGLFRFRQRQATGKFAGLFRFRLKKMIRALLPRVRGLLR
jgi:hypothetical protein